MGKQKPKIAAKHVVLLPPDVHELIVAVLKGRSDACISAASAQLLYQQDVDAKQWGVQAERVHGHTRGRYLFKPNVSYEAFGNTELAARAVNCFSVLPSSTCHDASPAHRLVAIMADGSIYAEYSGRRDDLHLGIR